MVNHVVFFFVKKKKRKGAHVKTLVEAKLKLGQYFMMLHMCTKH